MGRPSTPPADDRASFILGGGPRRPAPPPARGSRTGRRSRELILTVVILLVLSAGVSLWALQKGLHSSGEGQQSAPEPPPVRTNYCTTTTSATKPGVPVAELDPEQAGSAAIITAVAARRGLPTRAAAIAIATAMQESTLRNITYGDRDSLGLFQQRPSQGWGTRKQVTDPVHATNAFYDALIRVPGYRTMAITKAAQRVQHSAFPKAYAPYGPYAESIAAALSGRAPAGLTCVLAPSAASPQVAGRKGVTARAAALRTAVTTDVGAHRPRVLSPTTLRFHVPASAGNRRAWTLAEWAVARAADLDIVQVRVAGRVWDRTKLTGDWGRATAGRTTVVIEVA